MDLRLFHSTDDPTANYKRFDRLNSRTGHFACRMLELIGWYTSDVKLRLLGHYRLFHLYKRRRSNSRTALDPVRGYILQYRASYWIKHYWYLVLSRVPSLFGPDPQVEMYLINKLLVYERASVLHEFLANADTDFEQAFSKAVQQINSPEFINTAGITKHQQANVLVQMEQHTVNNHSFNELNIHPIVEKEKETVVKEIIVKEPAPANELTGKGKGVFSKKQVLIVFDLLAQTGMLEPLRLDNPEKHQAIAKFLVALTGKGLDTWLETLKDYHANHLYAFHTPAERANLMSILTNIADTAYAAGLRTITERAEKNIRLLREQE